MKYRTSFEEFIDVRWCVQTTKTGSASRGWMQTIVDKLCCLLSYMHVCLQTAQLTWIATLGHLPVDKRWRSCSWPLEISAEFFTMGRFYKYMYTEGKAPCTHIWALEDRSNTKRVCIRIPGYEGKVCFVALKELKPNPLQSLASHHTATQCAWLVWLNERLSGLQELHAPVWRYLYCLRVLLCTNYKIIAGHWPFCEQISKLANQNLDQLGINCMDGQPNWCYWQTKFAYSALCTCIHYCVYLLLSQCTKQTWSTVSDVMLTAHNIHLQHKDWISNRYRLLNKLWTATQYPCTSPCSQALLRPSYHLQTNLRSSSLSYPVQLDLRRSRALQHGNNLNVSIQTPFVWLKATHGVAIGAQGPMVIAVWFAMPEGG